ncbi:hypothetical protein PMAYCL1PPCAC_18970 [Pristionchus mayeri]|uniref:Uncharacterized protein n=1 Tax=Pristionchus mayeri TaxID=1317129 RepID=A0AAN5CQW9_9BILA|nr:hypothetical protein PMAYCL1PPCAC_18970 [Pristionchus mayeri]
MNVLQHKYSSLSDASKLVLVEARAPLRDGPLSISFYVVFTPAAAALLTLCFLLIYILNLIQLRNKRNEAHSSGMANLVRTLLNLVDFLNRLTQLFVIILLFSYYQSLFNGHSPDSLHNYSADQRDS